MKTLYHYTSIERWHLIEQAGRINTTESNISLHTEHAGPDVVWLTTDPDCANGHGIAKTFDGTDKTRVQIVVELPNRDVHKWRDWAVRRGMDPDWMRTFINGASGGAGTWRVTEKPIMFTRWVGVLDRSTGEQLWTPTHTAQCSPMG